MNKILRHVDLCSGIGGFSLGFRWAGLSEPILFCDYDEWCRKILAKHWPNVEISKDVKELANDPKRNVPDCDILTAGYPCQPFSLAGKRGGSSDNRHIWPYIFSIVKAKRPNWCIFENVFGHLSMGIDEVLTDLESKLGYTTRTFCVPAAGVNAPHKRLRLWIIAHTDSHSEPNVSKHEQRLLADTGCKLWSKGDTRGLYENTPKRSASSVHNQSSSQGQSSDEANTDIINRWAIKEPQQSKGKTRWQPTSNISGNVANTDSPRQQQSHEEVERGSPEQPDSSSVQSRKNVGNTSGARLERANNYGKSSEGFQQEFTQRSKAMAHTSGSKLKGSSEKPIYGQPNIQRQLRRSSKNQKGEWPIESKLGRVADGLSTRMDGFDGWEIEPKDIPRVVIGMKGRANRLKGLGNAIVPQVAMQIGLAIKEQLK